MNKRMITMCLGCILVACLHLFCFVNPARAGIVASGDVIPADPGTWTSSTYAYIGLVGSGVLNITSGSDVLDYYGYIGYGSSSTGEVTVDGPGSTWTNSSVYVGYSGSGVLNITNGGAVSNDWSYIGIISGSTGEVTVDGPGSTWTNGDILNVGLYGSGVLNITGGAMVSNGYSHFCRWSGSTGDVTVDGLGSTWTSSDHLNVGSLGSGVLNITGGGAVSNSSGRIGEVSGSTGEVTVNGPGSTWDNSGYLYVGDSSSGVLDITNGGAVTVAVDTWVALNSGSSGMIHFDNGTLTTGGLLCASDNLTGTGTINTGGLVSDVDLVFDATHGLNQTFNINDNPGQNITVNLAVDGSRSMGAGYGGVGTMSISDGRVIESISGYIGYKSSSMGEVTVDGTGSTWTNSHVLYVGREGSGVLNITDGGQVSNGYGRIGYRSGSTGVVTVDGSGSTWNSSRLYVGNSGSGTLNITGGGAVSNGYGRIGVSSGSTGEVTVDGTGSTWTNTFWLYVGESGSGVLNITGGGEVTVEGDTWVAYKAGASGTIHFDNGTLTTEGLLCSIDDLTGTGTINTHGLVSDVNLVFDATHGLNRTFNINDNPGQNITVNLSVNGSGSMGAGFGGGGTMSISDGIVIKSTRGYIGYKSGATGEVTVNGPGSTWTNRSNLIVGHEGSGVLNITGGSAVSNHYGYIGYKSGSTGEVTVDGTGSKWTNSSDLYVGGGPFGDSGSGVLNITGGGAVSNLYGYIGHESGATGEVTVDGAGSTWTNTYNLYVGRYGSGVLNITGGGLVSVGRNLTIDDDGEGGFINMATGGMLALDGNGGGSLASFLGLINGTDAIRYWDYPLGDWDDIANAMLDEDYTLTYFDSGDLAGYTMLTVLEPVLLAGDADCDGVVSADDYGSVQLNFGNMGLVAGIHGDANGDGIVSADDYGSVQLHFGEMAGMSGETTVPEPGTMSLLVIGGVALLRPFRQAQGRRRSAQVLRRRRS